MNRDALVPVVLVVLGSTLATAVVVATLQESVGLADSMVAAIDNGGLAVTLVAVFFLFDSTDYAGYRALGGLRILLDAAYVFVLATGVTALAMTGFGAAGVERLPATLGPLSVDAVEVTVSIAALFAGLYGFYLRNGQYFAPPGGENAAATA